MTTLSDQEFKQQFADMLAGKDTSLGSLKEGEPAPAATPDPTPAPAAVADPAAVDPAAAAPVVEPAAEPAKTEPDPTPAATQVVDPAAEKPAGEPAQEPAQKTAEQVAAEQVAAAAVVTPPAGEPDYKGVYERIFGKPIRAAGKDVTIKDVDEAVSLMQKGIGFHSKLNKVQSDVAIAETLRQAGIDQPTLNLLIDAQKGKPGAIKKLLDSAKLDPLTLDSAEASTYAPSDHRVTEAQVRFNSVVSDLTETSHGTAVLQDARDWDQTSKAEIFNTPGVLTELASQKESGRYDKIKAAVDRERMVGNIPLNESFLVSYTRVGQQLMQAGAFGTVAPSPSPTPVPVAQKVVTPAAPPNPKQVAAAAPTRSTPNAKTPVADPLKNLSDADFQKQFKATYKI